MQKDASAWSAFNVAHMAGIEDTAPSFDAEMRALEKDLRIFAAETKNELRAQLATMGLKQQADAIGASSRLRISTSASGEKRLKKDPKLYDSVAAGLKKSYGEIERINISFARHGIFIEHGVGKNRPVGTPPARQAAQVWLKNVLDRRLETLADLLEEKYAGIAMNQIRLLVPGIIDIRLKDEPRYSTSSTGVKILIDKSFF